MGKKETESVTESKKRGGYRVGAGRKGRYQEKGTTVIRIPSSFKREVIPFVDILADWLNECGDNRSVSASKSTDEQRLEIVGIMKLLAEWELNRQKKKKKTEQDKRQLNLF